MYPTFDHRTGRSSKLTGLSVTVIVTAIAGHALTSGLARDMAAAIKPATTIAMIPPEPEAKPEGLPPPMDLPTTMAVPTREPDTPNLPVFTADGSDGVRVAPAPARETGGGAGGAMLRIAPVRQPPRLRPGEPSPYPPSEIRAGHEGVTTLDVCVNAAGRVSSARIAASSAHARLDEAALKWVREARFAPGALDGVAQAMCGHAVAYEWIIETRR